MVNQPIEPVSIETRLAQILGDDFLAETAQAAPVATPGVEPGSSVSFSGNPFEDILAKAVESLEGVSKSEIYANEMIDKYLRGEVDLQQVMVVQSKLGIVMQLAVTTINTAVTTFKEITQMQV